MVKLLKNYAENVDIEEGSRFYNAARGTVLLPLDIYASSCDATRGRFSLSH